MRGYQFKFLPFRRSNLKSLDKSVNVMQQLEVENNERKLIPVADHSGPSTKYFPTVDNPQDWDHILLLHYYSIT